MSHLFLWVGQNPEGRLEAARRHFVDWKQARPDATLVCASSALLVAGSRARPAGLRRQSADPLAPALAWCGHSWPASGPEPDQTPVPSPSQFNEAMAALRSRLDGVFGLALVDPARGEAVVASDVLGSFHLYWRKLPDGVAISSSTLLLARLGPAALDPVGAQEFLSLAVPNEERTLWKDVFKLRGGTILRTGPGGDVSITPHRPLIERLRDTEVPLAGALENMHGAIGQALARLTGHGTPVTDLTGGNDSRALAAALLSHGHPFVSTVTGPDDLDDVRIGAELAATGGWRHDHRQPAPPPDWSTLQDALRLTDGEFDAFEFAGIARVHHEHRARGYALSMNGSYGETGRGYPWRLGPKAIFMPDILAGRLTSRTPIDAAAQSADRYRVPQNGLFREELRVDWPAHGRAMIERLIGRYPGLSQCAQLDLLHIDLRMERWQGRIASSTNQIWPAVSPWGFQAPLAALLTAHPRARRNSLLSRAYTARMAPSLADILLFTGNPARPFQWRHALSFAPALGWYARRAKEKLQARMHAAPATPPPSMAQRQTPALTSGPLAQWLASPLLAATGLMHEEALMAALRTDQPRSGAAATLWCRLATLEMALRAVSGDGAMPDLARRSGTSQSLAAGS